MIRFVLAISIALLTSLSAALASPATHEQFEAAVARVSGLVAATRQAPGAAPAYAVVAVRLGETPRLIVDGVTDARTGRRADMDTPFYIASMTKAYVGLMAAKLDADGVFDLDSKLTDVWPSLALPGVDAATITFRALLTHQAPITNEVLTFRTAYVDEVPAVDYQRQLNVWSKARPPGFQYDNLGYIIYGAALELKTGRSWRDWLQTTVLGPLGLRRTSTRISAFPPDEIAAAHLWVGERDWIVFPPKQDAVMHAAGGMVTSAADMARWLLVNLEREGGGIEHDIFAAAQTRQVEAKMQAEGVFDCEAYALGWHLCEIAGVKIVGHAGSYTGTRAAMAFAPDEGVGFAVMANSETMTGGLGARLTKAFFEALASPEAVDPSQATFGSVYADVVRKQRDARRKEVVDARAQPAWSGWSWHPSNEELKVFEGRYLNAQLGPMVVQRESGGLKATLGIMRIVLEPAAPNLFAATANPLEVPAPVTFERGTNGVIALIWQDRRYVRTPN